MLCVCAQSLQLCPTLCDPMDCSLPGSSVRGISQGMGTHASILAWEIPWTEEPGRLQPMGLQGSDTAEDIWAFPDPGQSLQKA